MKLEPLPWPAYPQVQGRRQAPYGLLSADTAVDPCFLRRPLGCQRQGITDARVGIPPQNDAVALSVGVPIRICARARTSASELWGGGGRHDQACTPRPGSCSRRNNEHREDEYEHRCGCTLIGRRGCTAEWVPVRMPRQHDRLANVLLCRAFLRDLGVFPKEIRVHCSTAAGRRACHGVVH
jgi:hypothetical protein